MINAITICLSTSTRNKIEGTKNLMGNILQHFTYVVSGEPTQNKKPHPKERKKVDNFVILLFSQ